MPKDARISLAYSMPGEEIITLVDIPIKKLSIRFSPSLNALSFCTKRGYIMITLALNISRFSTMGTYDSKIGYLSNQMNNLA